MPTRSALIGTGHRAQMYLDAIAGPHADVAELVALIDVNPARREFHRDRVPAFADVTLAGPDQLEQVIAEQRVDRVIVTSVDRLHAEHVVRSLEAGADVVVEKPLTIDAPSARAIQEAIDRTGRRGVVTFHYRCSPRNTALRQVIASGEIGDVVSVVFEWVLDTQHGADYFRRWHRDKANSGGLFVHKAAHHFDLVNWWLADTPTRVYARGGLRFYGEHNATARGQELLPERGWSRIQFVSSESARNIPTATAPSGATHPALRAPPRGPEARLRRPLPRGDPPPLPDPRPGPDPLITGLHHLLQVAVGQDPAGNGGADPDNARWHLSPVLPRAEPLAQGLPEPAFGNGRGRPDRTGDRPGVGPAMGHQDRTPGAQ